MKTAVSLTLMLALVASISNAATTVREDKTWSQTYVVSAATPRLEVSNIWGSVRVRPGKAGEIVVSVVESRSAASQTLFERSLQTIKLNVEADGAGLTMRVGDPEERWNKMNSCRDCRLELQFDILVPPDAVVDVGTVMDGLVDVKGVAGTLSASNVNGPIAVDDVHDCGSISSVNGKVDISFSHAPTQNCDIETINGDITLDVPADTSLDVATDLFNGKVVSDFPLETFVLPATVERVSKNGRNQYRIQQLSGLRIGAGGPVYSIASMNGDIRIQKTR